MRFRSLMIIPIIFATSTAAVLSQGGAGVRSDTPEYVSGPYEAVPNWPQPISKDLTWGRVSAVFAESPNRIFVVQSGMVPPTWKTLGRVEGGGTGLHPANDATHCAENRVAKEKRCTAPSEKMVDHSGSDIPGARWEHTLMIFDENGKLVESWEQHNKLFTHPHNVRIDPYDPERHVWVVDDQSEQVFKFTKDGKLVMTLGEFRVRGNDKTHFGDPTSIAWLPNGDFYISDGYFNTRVVKFSKDGKYLLEWGKPGKGPGEFNTVHSIAIDAKGRVYVADRGNDRIQVFDLNGNYITQWRNIAMPTYIAVTKDQHIAISDGRNDKMLKYDTNGRLLNAWGTFGAQPGHLWCVHGFSVDTAGNLYTAEVFAGRLQKFRPKKGADPATLLGPLWIESSLRAN